MNSNIHSIAAYCSIVLMTGCTIMEIIHKQTTVFYILYLFWFDEFIRTVFDRIAYYSKKVPTADAVQFLGNNKERFFMLGIYLVFIIVFFGIIIDWKELDLIGLNFEIFSFKNPYFNGSLFIFTLKEGFLFYTNSKVRYAKDIFSNGILTLHLSLLLGILIWFLSAQKWQFMVEYANVFAVIPFLIIKIIFELKLKE
ncbi:hypothetical protein [Flavobacterium sp. UMI-01]|uniref:hypothetical protein n=1 Tax=Flavobacterium sp. UMI-01 TaxID=1441053 RepID=UPI001C7D247E|nr:hypothetical protein [Flavobacterium sp. UMI-01]